MMGRMKTNAVMVGLMVATLAVVSGCNSKSSPLDSVANSATTPLPSPGVTAPGAAAAAAAGGAVSGTTAPPIVDGTCPQIALRDGTAYMRKFAGKKSDDQTKLVFQAALAETVRQCTLGPAGFTITVQAQGRLVLGDAGKAGSYTLPIRVAVIDGDKTVYSELVKFTAEVPAGASANQFLFTKSGIVIPGGIGSLGRIFLGFDEGPYNTK